MRMLKETDVAFFKENGYLHLKGVFTSAEVASFREGCMKDVAGDSMCRPEFRHIMFSARVVNAVKDLLGETIYYPGLSLTRTNDTPARFGLRFFHTDVVGDDGDFATEYAVLNTGMYLEDHAHFSGGLKIRPGSHQHLCVTHKTLKEFLKDLTKRILMLDFGGAWGLVFAGRSVNPDLMPGDLLLWWVRTHHSGYAVRPRFFRTLSLPPIIENWLPRWARLPDNPERNVILSIFAAPSKYLETYMKQQVRKSHRKAHFLGNACLEEDDARAVAREMGVTIRNDGYTYALNPTSTYDVRTGLKASGGQQYYG
jgi:hypothetical protein